MRTVYEIPQEVWNVAKGIDLLQPIEMIQMEIANAIMDATEMCLPKLENTGRYLAQDNTGQWHYINHAGTWQGCPMPLPVASVADDLAAIRNRGEA